MKTRYPFILPCLVLGAGLYLTPVHAATTSFVVDSLAPGVTDDNIGDGICQTAEGECTLRAALEEANALPPSTGDDISISFDATLSGDIVHTATAAHRMYTSALGNQSDYIGQSGAYLHVNAARPLSIDFDNRVGAVTNSDYDVAMFFIESGDVIIENFDTGLKADEQAGYAAIAGIAAGSSAFAISGQNVTIRNGLTADPETHSMETCIALLDGAADISVEDYMCFSAYRLGLYVDRQATVSNIALTRVLMQGTSTSADVWVGQGLDDGSATTTVNGMTVTDSDFNSSAPYVQSTIRFGSNSAVNDFTVTGSRFTQPNTRTMEFAATAQVSGLTVENCEATGTGAFLVDQTASAVTQTDYTIRNNIFTSVSGDVTAFYKPINNVLVEGNRFIDSRSPNYVGGVHVGANAYGINNVINNNQFINTSGPISKLAIYMQAAPGADLNTGWTFSNNYSENIAGTADGPISLYGAGDTLVFGNTFGPGSYGTDTTAPENGSLYFVNNNGANTNGKIQTWRPSGAVYTGSTIRVAVAPVDPPLSGNNSPTSPVEIDIYYSSTDLAEEYLGRIPGTHSGETVYEFSSTATGGIVRAQVHDASGKSSQYSAAVEVVEAQDSGADDDLDGLPNGAECTINILGLPILCPDTDGDGTPDYLDTDDDNDGIPTITECPDGSPCVDTDGDGTPNNQDLDSDGDGISDAQECPQQACRDTDGDGKANYVDTDSDGDDLSDADECPDSSACTDDDVNGVEDYLEPPPRLEARGTGGATAPWVLLMLAGFAARRRWGCWALMISTLAASSNALAEESGWMSRFYGGAQAGALFTDFDDKGLTSALQDAGYAVNQTSSDSETLGYGLWLGFALTPWRGLELSYLTGPDVQATFDGSTNGDLEGALKAAEPFLSGYGDSYALRARYHYSLSSRWFVSPRIGVGYTETRQTLSDNRERKAELSDDGFSWQAGVGIQRILSDHWSAGLQLDFVQGSSDNAYGLISAVVEWRFPQALPGRASQVNTPKPSPVIVVPPEPEQVEDSSSNTVHPPLSVPSVEADDQSELFDVRLQGVNFAFDGYSLTPQARDILDSTFLALGNVLQQRPELRIEVAGHTDATGDAAVNQSISQARAQSVRDYLVGLGIVPSRLRAVGYGSSQPVAPNDTAAGRALNRRVELRQAD